MMKTMQMRSSSGAIVIEFIFKCLLQNLWVRNIFNDSPEKETSRNFFICYLALNYEKLGTPPHHGKISWMNLVSTFFLDFTSRLWPVNFSQTNHLEELFYALFAIISLAICFFQTYNKCEWMSNFTSIIFHARSYAFWVSVFGVLSEESERVKINRKTYSLLRALDRGVMMRSNTMDSPVHDALTQKW